MPGLAECQSLLRLLIARGDPKAIPLAKGAIDQYLNTAPICMRGRGLRVLQRDALDQHGTAVGVQRSFAETVDAYIVGKLAASIRAECRFARVASSLLLRTWPVRFKKRHERGKRCCGVRFGHRILRPTSTLTGSAA